MDGKLYAERDIMEQGEFYTRHVMAMTAEGLHDKSSIAAELAHRDQRIAELEREATLARDMVANAEKLVSAAQTDYYEARRRIRRLEAALREAITMVRDWGAYADEYFQHKHDLAGDVAGLRAVLTQEEGG